MESRYFHSPEEFEQETSGHNLTESFFRHAQIPQNLGRLDAPSGAAKGIGSCGDIIEVHIDVADDRICEIRQMPAGCVYTTACGSAMSALVTGRSLEQALQVKPEDVSAELGGLPADHLHCASLAVNTLGEAIDDYYQKIWGTEALKNMHEPEMH